MKKTNQKQKKLLHLKQINEIFQIFYSYNPSPKTELNYSNDFTLLVAIILSAQSTDKGVNKATEQLFKVANNPEEIIKLGEENLKNYIKTIGLYNSKAKNIYALSQILIEKYNSLIPHEIKYLQELPGVGRKTANVFLNCAHGKHTIAVDTHVFRVSNRIGLTDSKNVLQTELELEKQIPSKWKKDAHHWLILHGRYTCKAKKPLCKICVISHICIFPDKNL